MGVGKIGATGMCLGGHLAFRAAFHERVTAAVCYFATGMWHLHLHLHVFAALERVDY